MTDKRILDRQRAICMAFLCFNQPSRVFAFFAPTFVRLSQKNPEVQAMNSSAYHALRAIKAIPKSLKTSSPIITNAVRSPVAKIRI